MLKVTSDGRKLGLDQRVINPMLTDDENSKVNSCVGSVLWIWEDGKDIDDLRKSYDGLWSAAEEIMLRLAAI